MMALKSIFFCTEIQNTAITIKEKKVISVLFPTTSFHRELPS